MKSLGKMHSNVPVKAIADEKEMYYPCVTLTQDMIPQLKGKDVDDRIILKVEAKIAGISKYGNGDIEYRLDLTKAEIVSK